MAASVDQLTNTNERFPGIFVQKKRAADRAIVPPKEAPLVHRPYDAPAFELELMEHLSQSTLTDPHTYRGNISPSLSTLGSEKCSEGHSDTASDKEPTSPNLISFQHQCPPTWNTEVQYPPEPVRYLAPPMTYNLPMPPPDLFMQQMGAMLASMSPPPIVIEWHVMVEFKRMRVECFTSQMWFPVGQHVIVEGDAGRDIGIVVQSEAASGSAQGLSKVLRIATESEVHKLHVIQAMDEEDCVAVAREKVAELQLEMQIVDAELQFDRRKITFHYVAESRVDFRELNRALYRVYRARIWMLKVQETAPSQTPSSGC